MSGQATALHKGVHGCQNFNTLIVKIKTMDKKTAVKNPQIFHQIKSQGLNKQTKQYLAWSSSLISHPLQVSHFDL